MRAETAEHALVRVQFGQVHAHVIDMPTAVDVIVERAAGDEGGFVLTPNVDHIAMARREPALADAYRRAFLALADGVPLLLISKLLGLPLREKVSGSDLFEPLVARCAVEGLPIFFLGSTGDACERATYMLKLRYPGLEITGYDDSIFDPDNDPERCVNAFRRARASGARVIFVCLPAAKQVMLSRFEDEYRPAVGIATGAALDFYVGDVSRAPSWVSRSGFEWLYRLIQEPQRLWRRYLIEDAGALPVLLRMVGARLLGRSLIAPEPEVASRPRTSRSEVPTAAATVRAALSAQEDALWSHRPVAAAGPAG